MDNKGVGVASRAEWDNGNLGAAKTDNVHGNKMSSSNLDIIFVAADKNYL